MIDPVILEHFRNLKEREELDAMLPEILTGMGLEVLSRPTIGNRQYGSDIAAVGPDRDRLRKIFLFSVKRGDLSRGDWDGPSVQSLRPSLNEIRDAYLRTITPEHRDLPVVIIAVVGGVVPEPVLPLVTGYMDTHRDGRFDYRLWTGDTLTKRLLEGALREEIFPPSRRAMLRKTAALVEQPEMALRHFGSLLEEVATDEAVPAETRVRTLVIATRVIFSWGREAGNLEVAYQASEELVLRAWELLHPVIEADRSRKGAASHTYFAVVKLHLDIWKSYIEDKLLPRAETMHALSFAVGSVEPLDINLALFEATGRIAAGGLLKLWMEPGQGAGPRAVCGGSFDALRIAKVLASIPFTNPTLQAPMVDDQSTDLGLALLLLCCFEDTREAARRWNRQVARSLIISLSRVESGPRYPSIDASYESLLRHPAERTEKHRQAMSAGTTLLPLVAMVAKILGEADLLAELDEFQREKVQHSNAQTWVPNERSEAKIWRSHPRQGSAVQDLEIGPDGDKLMKALRLECEENKAWEKLSAIRLEHWPLVAIACRRARIPLAPQLWMALVDDLTAFDGDNGFAGNDQPAKGQAFSM